MKIMRIAAKPVLLLLFIAMAVPVLGQAAKLELKNLEKLSSKAAEVNDITLEGDMLLFAAKFIDKNDSEEAEVKDLIKNLKGIYIKSFEFDKDDQYSQTDVDAIRSQLAAPGWTRMVESRSQKSRETNEIYLMKDKDAIAGVAILVAEPRELTIVNIVGPIDINRLSELEGMMGKSHNDGSHNNDSHNNEKPKTQNKTDKGAASNEKK
jgi:hypothetical protein